MANVLQGSQLAILLISPHSHLQITIMSSKHDEDDLDDLDDLLDEFADEVLTEASGAQKPQANAKSNPLQALPHTAASATDSSYSTSASKVEDTKGTAGNVEQKGKVSAEDDPSVPELDEEFAEKLKLGMNYLLSELDGNEGTEALDGLLSELSGATGGSAAFKAKSASKPAKPSGTSGDGKPAEFQDTISQTMDRLRESKSELDEQATQNNDSEDAFLSKIMKELEGASGVEGGLDGFLGEMLRELSSKEILYEPIKEMHDKYPQWLEKNKDKVSQEELARYKNQQRIIDEITARFESPQYNDSNEADKKYIADRMEEMQQSGAPPQELMGDISGGAIPGFDGMSGGLEGLGLGGDGMPSEKDLENCPVQ